MFEDILTRISELNPLLIYLTIFFFAFIENLFPPSPSDMVIVVGGSLVGASNLHFVPVLVFATGGSLVGFLTAFAIGWQLDKRFLHAGKIKFLTLESIEKVESAFRKYGYYLIVANRFLPGTRAVISFFAGMSRLNVHYTLLLSAASALLWNTILISLGMIFGENIQKVDQFLSTYNQVVIAVTVIVILFLIVRYFWKKNKIKN
ncbi:MAG: DedA family protein [Ignavibacterium sp.]|uniref:DedA family protein n=1 Tax=Ignavibacterium sp. TaxID=2651167 RepID=UPI0040490742